LIQTNVKCTGKELLKTSVGNTARPLSGSLQSKVWQLQNVSLQVIPRQVTLANKWRNSAKLSMAVDEVPLQRLLAG
jgi:hypothetical protein